MKRAIQCIAVLLLAAAALAQKVVPFTYGQTFDLTSYPAGTVLVLTPAQSVLDLKFASPLFSRTAAPKEGKLVQKVSDTYPWMDACVRWVGGRAVGNAGELARFNAGPGVIRSFDVDPIGTAGNEIWPNFLLKLKNGNGVTAQIVGALLAPAELLVVEDSKDCRIQMRGLEIGTSDLPCRANLVRIHGNRPAVLDRRGSGNYFDLNVTSLGACFVSEDARGTPATVTGKLAGAAVLKDMGVLHSLGETKPGSIVADRARIRRLPLDGDRPLGFDVGAYADNVSAKIVLQSCTVEGVDVGFLLGGTSDCAARDTLFVKTGKQIVEEDRAHWQQIGWWFPQGQFDGHPRRNVFERLTTSGSAVFDKPGADGRMVAVGGGE